MAESTLQGRTAVLPVPTQQAKEGLRRLVRREKWHWVAVLGTSFLAAVAFVLVSIPALFRSGNPYFQLDPAVIKQGLIGLLLLLNGWTAYRQWQFRRLRKQLIAQWTGIPDWPEQADAPGVSVETDPITGLCGRPSVEQWLSREMALARRNAKPLTLLLLDLDDFREVNASFGKTYGDMALQEFAKRLKKASRGSDLAARVGADEFLLALPDCTVGAAKKIIDRMEPVEIKCGGKQFSVTCSAAWIDYQPGESPRDLLRRADQTLALYKNAATDAASPALVAT